MPSEPDGGILSFVRFLLFKRIYKTQAHHKTLGAGL